MFDAYMNKDEDKNRRRRWVSVVIAGSVLAHMVVIIAITVAGMWKVEKNTFKGRTDITIRTHHVGVVAPPPLGKSSVKQHNKKVVIRKKLVTNRQPTTRQTATVKVDHNATGSDGPGREDGQVGGTGDDPNAQVTSLTACRAGELCGTGMPSVPRIEPPKLPPVRPKIVPANVIAGSRISGNARILPSDAVKIRIANAGDSQIVGAVLMCLSTSGAVASVKLVRSTGYNAYDQKLLRTMRSWRYRPYRVNSTAVPVCSSITFIYRQSR